MTPKQYEARKRARSAENLRMLCQSNRYWYVSPQQLARDLKGYRRPVTNWRSWPKYEPRQHWDADAYLAWCKSIDHTPHPASIDPNHPLNVYRDKLPPREQTDG